MLPPCIRILRSNEIHASTECVGVITSELPFSNAISDVWSLGIILANMITCRNPWHLASPERDEGFSQFLEEGATFLLRTLPISHNAARLLVRIFDPDPETRITLPELRKAVIEIETFFSTPNIPLLSKSSLLHHNVGTTDEVSLYTHHQSPSLASIVALAPSVGEAFSAFANSTSSFMNGDLCEFSPPPLSSGRHGQDSDADSEGPATPVTRVDEPAMAVPDDLALGGGVVGEVSVERAMGVWLGGSQQTKQIAIRLWTTLSSGYSSRFAKPVHRFVDAVQRVKVLG